MIPGESLPFQYVKDFFETISFVFVGNLLDLINHYAIILLPILVFKHRPAQSDQCACSFFGYAPLLNEHTCK